MVVAHLGAVQDAAVRLSRRFSYSVWAIVKGLLARETEKPGGVNADRSVRLWPGVLVKQVLLHSAD